MKTKKSLSAVTKFFFAIFVLVPMMFLSACAKERASKKPTVVHFVAYYDESDTRLPNPTMMTHLIFALCRVNADFSLQFPTKKMLAKVSRLKEINPDLKITLLVGGVKSEHFSAAVATEQARTTLLNNIATVVEEYNLDGIDLDWEFPKTQADVDNYTLLMRDFKARFPNKILTVDVGNEVTFLDFKNAAKYVDFFNLMSYDYSLRSHNAPLYASPLKNNNYVAKSAEKLMKLVPPEKILLGIPFYGISTAEKDKAQPQVAYRGIENRAKAANLTLCRNEMARAPFYFNSDMKIEISFDDKKSVREKCRYAKKKNLGGVMVWQCLFDDDDLTLSQVIADEYDLKYNLELSEKIKEIAESTVTPQN